MEEAYQGYLERQGQRAQAARAKRARLGKTGDLGSDEEADDDAEPAPVPELRVRGLNPKPQPLAAFTDQCQMPGLTCLGFRGQGKEGSRAKTLTRSAANARADVLRTALELMC